MGISETDRCPNWKQGASKPCSSLLRSRPSVDSATTTRSTHSPPSQIANDCPPRTAWATAAPGVEIECSMSDLPNANSDQQILEEQHSLEGDIDNYNNSASSAFSSTITSAVVSAVEIVTPSMIRIGSRLASLASVGLLGLFTLSHIKPVQIIERNVDGGGRRPSQDRSERYLITGLVSTLSIGVASVGGAHISRYLVRHHLVENRQSVSTGK